MNQLEVFFDYVCPYCLRGHNYLLEILPEFPGLEIKWRPCEAHPRPEDYGRHSDICIRGMFFALENNLDIFEYHKFMYNAAMKDKIDIEDAAALSEYLKPLTDPAEFRAAMESGKHIDELNNANDYAYEKSGVWAIPSYRMNDRKLDSKEGVGIKKDQLAAFIRETNENGD